MRSSHQKWVVPTRISRVQFRKHLTCSSSFPHGCLEEEDIVREFVTPISNALLYRIGYGRIDCETDACGTITSSVPMGVLISFVDIGMYQP